LKKQHLLFWLGLLALVLSLNAWAGSAATWVEPTISYIKDDSATATVQEIAQRTDFQPTSSNSSFGFTRANVWLKLELGASATPIENAHLSIWPPRLENVQLFKVSHQGQIEEILVDKQYLKNGNQYYDAFKSTMFELHHTDHPSTYLLRLHSDFSLLTKIEVLDQSKLNEHRTNIGFLIGSISFGLAPFIMIFLFFSIKNRNVVYASYLLNIIGIALFYLASVGLDFANLLEMNTPSLDAQVGYLAIVSPLTTYVFLSFMSELLGVPAVDMKNMRVWINMLFVLSASYFLFEKQSVSTLFLYVNFALSLYVLLKAYKHFNHRNTAHMMLLIVFIAINLAAINVSLSLLGLKQSSDDVFITRSIRIAFVPFALILLITHFEDIKNQELIQLEVKRIAAEQNKTVEINRRQTYENFVTMLLHEIKTPLSIIQIAAGSLSRNLSPNTSESNRVENIKLSVIEINQIFNKCMQVIDLENDALHVDASEFSVVSLVDDIRRSLHDSRIVFNSPYEGKIFTDYVILKTILSNLLTNALKYGQRESMVYLEIAPHLVNPKQLVFKVTNTPSDVGQPDADKVFQRFYRAESAKKFGGSGQGLWLSQQLATMMNSSIELSTTSEETCFTLTLTMM